MKPVMCVNNRNAPVLNTAECTYWMIKVDDLSQVSGVNYDHAYILPDNSIYVWNYNGTNLLPLKSDYTFTSPDGSITITRVNNQISLQVNPDIFPDFPEITGNGVLVTGTDPINISLQQQSLNDYLVITHPDNGSWIFELKINDIMDLIAESYYNKNEVENMINQVVSSLVWKPHVNTKDDLATTYPTPEEGWTVYVNDENTAYRWDGTQWVDIFSVFLQIVTENNDGIMTSAMLAQLNKATNDITAIEQTYVKTTTSGDGSVTITGNGTNARDFSVNYAPTILVTTTDWSPDNIVNFSDSSIRNIYISRNVSNAYFNGTYDDISLMGFIVKVSSSSYKFLFYVDDGANIVTFHTSADVSTYNERYIYIPYQQITTSDNTIVKTINAVPTKGYSMDLKVNPDAIPSGSDDLTIVNLLYGDTMVSGFATPSQSLRAISSRGWTATGNSMTSGAYALDVPSSYLPLQQGELVIVQQLNGTIVTKSTTTMVRSS